MAPKKLAFASHGGREDEEQSISEPSDEERSYDSGAEEKEGTAPLPTKKPKVGAARPRLGPEPREDGSACSSPSASGFVVMPAGKPNGNKTKKTASASKVFSYEDVIALLKGLAVFWADGRNNKWAEFHSFIKDDLSNEFTKIQVSEKIRALKKKFETNLERARNNSGHLDFSDPHESIVSDLSKALWADGQGIALNSRNGAENEDKETSKIQRKKDRVDEHHEVNKKSRKRKQVIEHDENKISEQEQAVDQDDDEKINTTDKGGKSTEDDEENNTNTAEEKGKQGKKISMEEFQAAFPLVHASFHSPGCPKILQENCHFIPLEKARELEQKWRKWNTEALRLELKQIDLMKKDLEDRL